MSDPVLVALIGNTAVVVTQIMLFLSNRKKLIAVEQNTNNKLDQVLTQRNLAASRADTAEGHAAGITAEQERTKSTSDNPVIMKIEEPISVKLEDKDKGPK